MSEINVTRLKYPDNVRKNVGMYLGETNNFTTPLREIINNSVDELINGHGETLLIQNNDKVKLIVDNGRGIPIYIDSDNPDKTITHGLISETHVGGKFANFDEKTGGLHGVGSTAVNAVSLKYMVIVNAEKKDLSTSLDWIRDEASTKDKPVYVLCYEAGIFSYEKIIDYSELSEYVTEEMANLIFPDFSTAIYIEPDLSIYSSPKSRVSILPLKLIHLENEESEIIVNGQEIAPFNYEQDILEGLNRFHDETFEFYWDSQKDEDFTDFHYNAQLEYLKGRPEAEQEAALEQFGTLEDAAKKMMPYLQVKGYFSYTKDSWQYAHSGLINLIENPQGGYLERNISAVIGQCLHKMDARISINDSRISLNLFSVSYTNAKMKFSSQTKERLVDITGINDKVFRQSLEAFIWKDVISKNKEFFESLIKRIREYKATLNNLSSKEFIESKITYGDDNERNQHRAEMAHVYRCDSNDKSRTELYITEGKSASGNIVKFRDKKYQSVMPLRGKLWNTSTIDTMALVSNSETLAITNEIGAGVGDLVRPEACRYSKVIIATDMDSDGFHIANLVLGLFLTHTAPLVETGKIFKLDVPYYAVKYPNKKDLQYYYYDQKNEIDWDKAVTVEKRKGLGSYTNEEVKKFLVGENRRLIQITISDLAELEQSRKLLYSSSARKALMVKMGIFE